MILEQWINCLIKITNISFVEYLMILLNILIGDMSGRLAPNKSQCSSLGSDREENFESYGENDVGIDGDDK